MQNLLLYNRESDPTVFPDISRRNLILRWNRLGLRHNGSERPHLNLSCKKNSETVLWLYLGWHSSTFWGFSWWTNCPHFVVTKKTSNIFDHPLSSGSWRLVNYGSATHTATKNKKGATRRVAVMLNLRISFWVAAIAAANVFQDNSLSALPRPWPSGFRSGSPATGQVFESHAQNEHL